jgi:hypothetical protein
MVETSGHLRLSPEAPDRIVVLDQLGRENLEGNGAGRAGLPGLVYLAHAPLAEEPDDFKFSQFLSDLEHGDYSAVRKAITLTPDNALGMSL